MAKQIVKSFNKPDEVRPLVAHGEVKIVRLGGGTVGMVRFEPGWRWSTDVKPIVGTASCQQAHSMYVISGRIHTRMDSGEEFDLGPGDVATIEPGHDAWVLGDEPLIGIDWSGMATYALPTAAQQQRGTQPQPPAVH